MRLRLPMGVRSLRRLLPALLMVEASCLGCGTLPRAIIVASGSLATQPLRGPRTGCLMQRCAPLVMSEAPHSNLDSIMGRLPNVLTVGRVTSLPVLVGAYYVPCTARARLPAVLFAATALTDLLDGYLARRLDAQSEFGAFLDPVADKLLVCTVLTVLAGSLGPVVAIPASLIICREIAVSALREWMAARNARDDVAVGWAGKVKTATQMLALQLLLLCQTDARTPPTRLLRVGFLLLYVSCALTVSSGVSLARRATKSLWNTSSPRVQPPTGVSTG